MGFGTITDILNASVSNSYSFWFFGTFVIGVTAVVRVNQFSLTKITGNTYSLYYDITYEANRFGDTLTSEIIGAYVNISYGGVSLIDDWDYNIWWTSSYNRSGSFTITINQETPANLYINVSCWAGGNSRDIQATATTSQTFRLLHSEDQIVTATTAGYQNMILLPQANTDTKGKLYFYKNFSATRSLICPLGNQTLDNAALTYIFLEQYEGVILFNNGSNWFVASYYNKDRLLKDGSSASDGNIGNAEINKVNIREATSNSTYYSWNLPDPITNSGKMCILAYGGYYTNTSHLLITSAGSIDNGYYDSGSNKAYILTDGAGKSTGAILVSNGSTWCIMGSYKTDGVSFNNSTGTDANITATAALQINISPSLTAARRLLLPPYSALYNGTGSQLLVLKTTAKSGGTPEYFRTDGTSKIGTGASSSFNACDNIYRANAYACTIFVSRKKESDNSLEYFPVCNYS